MQWDQEDLAYALAENAFCGGFATLVRIGNSAYSALGRMEKQELLLQEDVYKRQAVTHAVTPADYMAFSAAYGMMSAGVLALGQVVTNLADSKPLVEMAEPLLQTQPETAQGRRVVTQLRGQVELSHISFRYGETGPWLLDNLRVKIEPGEYVALVGRTGCGKSTLVRLLLGFETPQRGAVYYDNACLLYTSTSWALRIGNINLPSWWPRGKPIGRLQGSFLFPWIQ